MNVRVSVAQGPALGDIRTMGEGDTVWLAADVETRKDWPRFLDALAIAVTRGADVRWLR